MSGTVVIGLGNPILGDDGVGLRVAQALRAEFAGVAGVVIKELHAGGLRVMDAIAGYERAVIVDAMCTGARCPGASGSGGAVGPGAQSWPPRTTRTSRPRSRLGRMLGLPMPHG
jgi:hypothetical protein